MTWEITGRGISPFPVSSSYGVMEFPIIRAKSRGR